MIQHTIDWYNGEIFEAKFIAGFGIALIVIAFLFNFLGNTSGAKAVFYPLIVTGVIFIGIGAPMAINNAKKLETIQVEYEKDKIQFQQDEIKRVEGFQYLYPMSIVISLISFLVALGLLYFVKNIHWQSIAISLILFGTAFAIIDYFSKERANIYYEHLKLQSENV